MKDDFYDRVNYAIQCIERGTTGGRKFQEVFEKYDEIYVITAIVRKAVIDGEFYNKLVKFTGERFSIWLQVASEFYNLSRQQLKAEAARTRKMHGKIGDD